MQVILQSAVSNMESRVDDGCADDLHLVWSRKYSEGWSSSLPLTLPMVPSVVDGSQNALARAFGGGARVQPGRNGG